MVQIDDSAYQRRAGVVAPYGMVGDVGMCEWTVVRRVSEEVAYIGGAAVLLVMRRVDVRADDIRPYRMVGIGRYCAESMMRRLSIEAGAGAVIQPWAERPARSPKGDLCAPLQQILRI